MPIAKAARVSGWALLVGFLAVFTVFESAKYGLVTTAGAVVGLAIPEVAGRLSGRAPRTAAALRAWWLPTVLLVVAMVSPVGGTALFTAGLGWLTRITAERLRP